MTDQPFYEETQQLFEAINALDLDRLRGLVDDDYGIVDVDPEGKTVVINDVDEWESYMRLNFGLMDAAKARLETDVLDYNGIQQGDMGYSVVRFVQHVDLGTRTIHNTCIATIIWKQTPEGWKESRWHCSPVQVEEVKHEDIQEAATDAQVMNNPG